MMRLPATMLACLGMLFAGAAAAADSMHPYIGASRGADVHAKPARSSPVLGHLERLTEVRVLEQRRGWGRIETIRAIEGRPLRGWVLSGQIRRPYQPKRSERAKSSFLAAFSSWFGNDEPERKTAVLGVRGLEDEGANTMGARNMKAVRWMDRLAVDEAEIARFIREGRLNP